MLPVILVGLVVIVCILVHFEMLSVVSRQIRSMGNHRVAILVAIFGLLLAHTIEIWLFAFGYFGLDQLGLGNIEPPGGLLDYAYYSSVVYTTLGFGDQLPTRALRILTGAESLTGLALIAWSATFTFVLMQRYWDR